MVRKLVLGLVLVIGLAIFISCFSASAATLNVPGTYATITLALAAASDGDTIQVAAGEYTETVIVNKEVTIQGAGAASTTITAVAMSPQVLTISSDNVKIDGFTLQMAVAIGFGDCIIRHEAARNNLTISNNILRGIGDGLAGALTNSSTVTNLTFSANTVANVTIGILYTGLGTEISTATINNNTFTGNAAALVEGQAINLESATNVNIYNNTFSSWQSAITCNGGSDVDIYNNTVTNSITGVGLMSITGISSCEIYNNLITDMSENSEAGIKLAVTAGALSDNIVINNTINNIANSGVVDGVGISLTTTSTGGTGNTFTNNIVANCDAGVYTAGIISGNTLDYNCVYNNTADYIGTTAGTNDISEDPLFVSNSDYQLQSTSPCIDAGTSTNAPATDKDGTTRPQGSGVDMGCYEASAITSSQWYFAEGNTNFNEWLLIQNPGSTTVTATATFYNTSGNTTTQSLTIPPTSRYSLDVSTVLADVEGFSNTDVATKLALASSSIRPDRAMYWNIASVTDAGNHCTKGSSSTSTTWYLAEGSTASGFDMWLLLLNPNSSAATVTLTFYTEGGSRIIAPAVTVPATSRYSYHVNSNLTNLSDSNGFATSVSSDQAIVVERSLYGSNWGTCSLGSTATATTWYFAEGTTAGNYSTYFLLLNNNSSAATATFTFMDSDGNTSQSTTTVRARSRKTVLANGISDIDNTVFSTQIVSTAAIVAERAMYWDSGAHCTIGASATGTTWYLAEGATRNCTEYILIMNPNTSSAATVTPTIMQADGTTIEATAISVPATSRATIKLNDIAGASNLAAAATKLESSDSIGIVVERSMYRATEDGSCSIGHAD